MEITGFFNVTRIFLGLLTQEIFGGNLFEDVARAQEIFEGDRYYGITYKQRRAESPMTSLA